MLDKIKAFFKPEEIAPKALAFCLVNDVFQLVEIYEERKKRLKKKQPLEVFFKAVLKNKLKELDTTLFILDFLYKHYPKILSTLEALTEKREDINKMFESMPYKHCSEREEKLFVEILDFLRTDKFNDLLTAFQEPH